MSSTNTNTNRPRRKLSRREHRRIRESVPFQQIQTALSTSDSETTLLLMEGDLVTVDSAHQITGQPWARTHLAIGLTAGLVIDGRAEVNVPWLIDDRGKEVLFSVTSPVLVLFLDRRYRDFVVKVLAGRVDLVNPTVDAAASETVESPSQKHNRRAIIGT